MKPRTRTGRRLFPGMNMVQQFASATLADILAIEAEALRAGRLEQACADCGTWEAAGSYCTKCHRPMVPDDWYRNGDEDRRAVAHHKAAQIASTRVKRHRGHPSGTSSHLDPATRAGVEPLTADGRRSEESRRLLGSPVPGSGPSPGARSVTG